MTRRRNALVLLLGVVMLLGSPRVSADEKPANRIDAAAAELLAAWRAEDLDRVRKIAGRTVPDRFRLVVRIALRTKNADERRAVLYAIAKDLDAATPKLAAHARAWAQASDEVIADERAVMAKLMTPSPGRPHGHAPAPPSDPKDAPTTTLDGMSVARPLLLLESTAAKTATYSPQASLGIATTLLAHAEGRGWNELAYAAHMLRARVLRRAGRKLDAARALRAAAQATQRAGNPQLESHALQFAFITFRVLGHTADEYECLLRLRAVAGGPAIELALALAESDLGLNDSALARITELIASPVFARAPARTRSSARQLQIGLLGRAGRLVEALAKADAVLAAEGLTEETRRRAHISTASVYHRLGLLEQALSHLIGVLDAPGASTRLAESSFGEAPLGAARILHELGRTDEALARLTHAEGIYRAKQKTRRLVTALRNRARILQDTGRTAEALASIDEAIRLSQAFSPRNRANNHLLRADLHLASAQFDAAAKELTEALRLVEGNDPDPLLHAHLMTGLGRVAVGTRRLTEGSRYFADATRLLIAASVGASDAEGLAFRRQIRRIAALGMDACARRLREPDAKVAALTARAWWFREAGHALLLAHALDSKATPDTQTRYAANRVKLAATLQSLGATQAKLVRARSHPDTTPESLEALTAELDASYRTFDETAALLLRADRIKRAAPTRPRALDETVASLAKDEAMLAYWVGTERVYGFCLSASGATTRDLGSAQELIRELSAWRQLVSVPGGPAATLGHRLHQRLVAPFASQVAAARRLTVLPDGPLAQAPFGAFVVKPGKADVRTFLIDTHVITYAPSATVLDSLRRRTADRPRGKGLLAVGNADYPDTGLPGTDVLAARQGLARLVPLPESGREVQAIGALYPKASRQVLTGPEARVGTWQRALLAQARWDTLHFACHAFVDDRRPALGGLILTNGEVLSAARLRALPVRADLVVLSACNTGGGALHAGEGVLGLSRALFHAGTTGVVVSTWRAADAAAADLMIAFHTHRKEDGLDTASALHKARLALRQGAGPRAHPYYWAPFILLGAPR